MTNNLLFCIILICPVFIFAQEYKYVPFPDSDAIWSEVYQPGFNGSYPPPVYERFALNGEDTVINDTSYHKIYLFYDTVFNKSSAVCIGGIREDSSKKIFYRGNIIHFLKPSIYNFWNISDSILTELLLYDFSLSIGDTLKEANLSLGNEFIIVTSIDTILIGDSYRKQFSFEPIWWVKWIEGIGNIKGLLFTSGDLPFNGIDDELLCFKQNNKMLYFNNNYGECMPLITDIEVNQYNKSAIIVYPIPATKDGVTFEFDNCSISYLEIFDCNGSSHEMYEVGENANYILKMEKYQPGVYFYKATDKEGIGHTGKFVVQ